MVRNPLLAIDSSAGVRRRITELTRAWEQYVTGTQPPSGVRPAIAASWERCRQAGVDPHRTLAPVQVDEATLAQWWREDPLARELESVLNELALVVPDSGHLVVVTDHKGLILSIQGDSRTRRRAEAMNFLPGAAWSEESAGTNAIGTALAAGTPIQVLAAEHLCEIVHPWTCSAAPIRDPSSGAIRAVIDVTGFSREAHPHSLAAVMAAARAVEDRLRERAQAFVLLLRSEYLKEAARHTAEPLAALDAGGRVVAYSPWLAQVQLIDAAARLTLVPEGLLAQARHQELAWEVEGPQGEPLRLHLRAVWSGSHLAGYLVRIQRPTRSGPPARGARGAAGGTRYTFSSIIGSAPRLREALRRAQLVAEQSMPVLLLGESGTGKEMVAQAIHNASQRRDGPFVALNCAAIPSELLASELFGYEAGAFTGARREGHPGKFEQAQGGTLFLDEIGDMPLSAQAHLLRVLEEKAVVRIGGSRAIPVDARIIAATHADLEQRIEEGRFRADLYYRLAAWRIELPPLRERPEDVGPILTAFLGTFRGEMSRPPLTLSPAALAILTAYSWPGNVREVRNLAMQLALEVEGPAVLPEHLPPRITKEAASLQSPAAKGVPPPQQEKPAVLRAVGDDGLPKEPAPEHNEAELLRRTVAECGGNMTQAARRLGIHRSTLYRRLARCGV